MVKDSTEGVQATTIRLTREQWRWLKIQSMDRRKSGQEIISELVDNAMAAETEKE